MVIYSKVRVRTWENDMKQLQRSVAVGALLAAGAACADVGGSVASRPADAAAAPLVITNFKVFGADAPSNKLNIALIGAYGRGSQHSPN